MLVPGVGFWRGAGIPDVPVVKRSRVFVQCGCCGAYHRADFFGDCREDSERYWDLPDDCEAVIGEDEED